MAETISMPKLGFDMAEGLLVRWVKQVGENINKGDVLAEIETDKATVEVESSASGVVLSHIVDQGSMVPVNAPIAIIGAAGEKVDAPAAAPKPEAKAEEKSAALTQPTAAPAPSGQSSAPADNGPVKASPLARKVAKDNGVNLASVQGSGPGGRVVRKDVEAALAGVQTSKVESRPQPSTINYQLTVEDKVIPTTKLRQAIGRRLVESKQTIPHFYVTHEYKMEAVMDMRKQINAYLPDNEKVSVNDFIIKAAALTLRQFPNLNATLKGNEIIQFGHVNVSVAVTVPGGLMTVVVKDADVKSLRQISC